MYNTKARRRYAVRHRESAAVGPYIYVNDKKVTAQTLNRGYQDGEIFSNSAPIASPAFVVGR